ncbi:hypothetical protein H257_00940 [Aphanomyces astaci]|uniref:Uncharacterized protein n=1 Tax=Aphanomyces astaci TaxID=112090 RepID=W4H7P4_APHAT|nr:hypothetical protein H257_00940 [Aphanomyces astaci]ETV87324.1 hypothetical protein H257_00940 [Aphanomyces astaci]|eukprot:XP_009822187.1 hypothetical protein H257_00940 [Aphanomyces astaci]
MGVLFAFLAPPSGRLVGPIFAIHLVTASLFTWIIIFNVYHSPSQWATLPYRAHCAGSNGDGGGAGGCLQVDAQLLGWYQIRRKDVKGHKISMVLTFYYGCLIPM